MLPDEWASDEERRERAAILLIIIVPHTIAVGRCPARRRVAILKKR
jgi:hypothetical protein